MHLLSSSNLNCITEIQIPMFLKYVQHSCLACCRRKRRNSWRKILAIILGFARCWPAWVTSCVLEEEMEVVSWGLFLPSGAHLKLCIRKQLHILISHSLGCSRCSDFHWIVSLVKGLKVSIYQPIKSFILLHSLNFILSLGKDFNCIVHDNTSNVL